MNSSTRTVVLLALLGVVVAAAGYDFLYARPMAKKIHDEIFNYCDDSLASTVNANSDNKPRIHSPGDIHKMLGEKFNGGSEYLPSKTTVEGSEYLVETYSVMAGAVIRSHDIHVIYSSPNPEAAKTGGAASFLTAVQGEYPKADLLPTVKTPIVDPNAPAPNLTPAGVSAGPTSRPKKEEGTEEKKEEGKEENKDENKEKSDKPADETKPAETPKTEEKPAEPKPEETKPEEKPAEKPAEEKPAEEEPAEKPPEEKPAEKPTEEKPAEEKPAEKPEEKPSEPKK